MQARTRVRRHNLINCFFIALSLSYKKLFQVEYHRGGLTDSSVLTFYPDVIKENIRAGSCSADNAGCLSRPEIAFVGCFLVLGASTTYRSYVIAYPYVGRLELGVVQPVP